MTGPEAPSLPAWLSRRAVASAAALVALCVWAAAAWLIAAEREELIGRALDRAALHARVMEDHAARTLNAVDLALDAAAMRSTPAARPHSAIELAPPSAATPLALPYLRSMAWLDAQGLVLASTQDRLVGTRVEWLALAGGGAGQESTMSPAPGIQARLFAGRDLGVAGAGSGQHYLLVLRRWGADGWVAASLNPDYFANQHALILDEPQRSGALLAWGGELLTATPALAVQPGTPVASHAVFREWLPGRETGVWVGPGLDGQSAVQAFRAVRSQPLLVWAAEPLDVVTAPLAGFVRQVMLAATGLSMALAGMAMAALRSLRGHAQVSRALALADARVASSERDLRTLVEGVHEWLFRTDAQGRLIYVNPRWRIVSRWGDAHALGRFLEELFAPEDRERLRHALARVGQGEAASGATPVAFETFPGAEEHRPECQVQARLLRAQAPPLSMEISLSPLRDAAGRRIGCAGFAVDVSEREAARQRLQAQLDFTAQLLAATPVPLFVTGLDGRVLSVNRAWEDLLTQGLLVEPLLAPVAASQSEWQIRTAAGQARDVVVTRVPFTDEAGQPAGTIGSVVDVTEFRAMARAARAAHEAAEAVNQLKSEFISNISHELRTPLQSILGYAELGRSRTREQPRLADMFARIHGGGQRMLALVNDLLDASHVSLQPDAVSPVADDFGCCLDRAVRAVLPQAVERHIVIETRRDEGLSTAAFVDPVRVQQAIRIILMNALKFAPGGSVVSCHLTEEGGWLALRISDRGPGIPEAELESIFQPFVQSSRTRDGSGGAGLGLGIARRILRAHGGDVRAANREGGGAVLTLKLQHRHVLPVAT